MTESWDAAGYIASSRYRLAVCEYLTAHGPGLPSEIASDTDLAQPHVSRALSELRNRDVVELLVPESQQKGRLYDLTNAGRVALHRLSHGRQGVDIQLVERTEFSHEGVIEYLVEEYGDDVIAVARYDDGVVNVHFFGALPKNYEQSPIVRLWSALGANGELLGTPQGSHEFTVYGLENTTLIDIPFDGREDAHIGVSLNDEADVTVRTFVEKLETQLTG